MSLYRQAPFRMCFYVADTFRHDPGVMSIIPYIAWLKIIMPRTNAIH